MSIVFHNGTWWEIARGLDSSEWLLLANGVQQGEPMDHTIGCGTRVYPSFEAAIEAREEAIRAEGEG